MSKLRGYKQFNESRHNRNKGGKKTSPKFGSNVNTPLPSSITANKTGMPMAYSERFKYIINKIANKNNAIAKELLLLPSKSGETFYYSYLDLEGAESLSYLYYTDKGISEEDKYKSPKRQRSKVYKVIKSIFGGRFTKTDVTKFVSMYKTIYTQGPDKADLVKSGQSDKQLIDKIVKDTKNGKLKWIKNHDIPHNMINYSASTKITDKKEIKFTFYRFVERHEPNTTMTIYLINDMFRIDSEKRKWIKTLKFDELSEFFKVFVEKYEKNQ